MKKNYILSILSLFIFSIGYSQISSFPHTTTFESASDISTTASDVNSKWVTRTDGDWTASEILWTRLSGSTPSTNTGPTAAQAGSYYVYVETSGSSNGDDAELSCNYDFTGKTEASISFNYHNWGVGSGVSTGSAQMALYVYNVTDSQWSSALWSNDPGVNSGSNTWYSQTVDLSAYDGKSVQIWFTLNSRGWASDGALDNIEVTAYTPNGVTAYFVDDSGSNSNNGLTSGAPFATLAKALSVSDDAIGVTINIGAGTYTEEDLTISRSNITISGAGSSQTIFDGDLDGRFATISANNTTIQNLQIKEYGVASSCTSNGSCGGGAILVGSSKTGFVVNKTIFDGNITNGTSGDGGAIEFLTGSTSTINSTIFRNNKAGSAASYQSGRNGGATKGNGSCTVTFNNCLFHENVARGYSGAHTNWMNDGGSSTFNNCTIEGNTQYDSSNFGAVSALYGTVNMTNSIIRNTIDGSAGAGSARDIYFVTGVNLNYGVEGSSSLSGSNSTSDPLFTDTANDDYTLQSGSVAIDAGNSTYAPADDINDLTRPQGQADDIGAYEHANTWDGSSSTAWATAANWSENIVPVSGRSPVIADVANDPDISTAVTLEDLTIQSGTSLDITSTGSITLTDDFTNNSGTLTISSGGSLIVNGTASGTITYTRTLGSTNWYLMASPVIGETYDDTWVSNNGIASSGSNRAIATYDTSDDTWDYFQAGSSATFQDGQGYAIRRSSSGTVSFTGTMNTDNETETLTTTGNGFNLLGNPYPSYINSGSILSANSGSLDQQTIWLWNQSTASYDTKVANDAFKIAPGQGFFVKSDGSGDVSILESYQSHQSDTFQGPIMASPEIYLTLTDDSNTRYTRIKYNENATTGFDNGYDGEMFGATSNAFAIYTHLVGNEQGQVGNSQGHGYAVQSLPTDNYENMIVPVGINATRGTTINIEATLNNFPEGVNIYLADKQENSVTLLETDTSYSTTLEEDHNGVGRFYIHTTPNALSSGEVMDSIPLSIYSLDSETLTIEGVATGTAYLQLYTMLGEELLQTSFEGTGVNRVLLPYHLNTGIYIVKIATTTGVTSKKIMIN